MVQIVTAELKTEGNKDVVIYKIRVGDDTGEWTVSRRFRNFETLHRALRCLQLPSLVIAGQALPRAVTCLARHSSKCMSIKYPGTLCQRVKVRRVRSCPPCSLCLVALLKVHGHVC